MKILALEDDVVTLYVKLKYPDKIVVVLYNLLDSEYVEEFIELFNLSIHQARDYIFIDFEGAVKDAIDFCDTLDGDAPYCSVIDYFSISEIFFGRNFVGTPSLVYVKFFKYRFYLFYLSLFFIAICC